LDASRRVNAAVERRRSFGPLPSRERRFIRSPQASVKPSTVSDKHAFALS
jgi:hypothetical protein